MTLRAKILILVIGILVFSSWAIMYFTRGRIREYVIDTSQKFALTTLDLVMLDIENEYNSITAHEEYAIQRYKDQLVSVTSITLSQIDAFCHLSQLGALSEDEAKYMATDMVSGLRYQNNDYFFIYDMDGVTVAHPDSTLIGMNRSDFHDIKGNPAVQNIKNLASTGHSGFLNIWYTRLNQTEPGEKLCYITLYPEWQWIVGTGVYIDDINSDTRHRYDDALMDLKETFSKTRLGRTGYVFMFNGSGGILIHPHLPDLVSSSPANLPCGERRLREFIEAASHPDKPITYISDKADNPGQSPRLVQSYIRRFPALDWYVATSYDWDEMEQPAKQILMQQGALVSAISLFSILLALLIIRRVTRPLKLLTRYTNELSEKEFHEFPDVERQIMTLGRALKDEIGMLARAFAHMLQSLKQSIEELRETTASKEKIESELRIAHDIQMSMLPHPPVISNPHFELAARLVPAKEVGGDLYDYFFINDNHLCVVVGDVSDKGVPAALFMSKSKTAIRLLTFSESHHTDDPSPARIIERVNNELCVDNEYCMFVTLFLGIVDTSTGQMTWASGGHNPPVFISSDAGLCFLDHIKGRVLGVIPDAHFGQGAIFFKPGDTLFIYTDGVTEAMNKSGELFSEERLMASLDESKSLTVEQIGEAVLAKVREHAHGFAQSDDIALLTFRYTH
ncbi:MAG: cache domain-containing protein [bacterium]|nr:cache domain-containing protein [Candidatus Sumerlaeota bacterium]